MDNKEFSKKKIVHISQPNYGGVFSYITSFIAATDDSKWTSFVICSDDGLEDKNFINSEYKIYTLPMVRRISIINDFKSFLRIKKIIDLIKPDIIYLHSSKAGAIGRLLISKRRIKIFYNPHGWSFIMNIKEVKKRFYALLEQILAINTTRIISISDAEYFIALRYGIPKQKIIKISSGVDIKKFSKINSNLVLNTVYEDTLIIGFVGRLHEAKGPLILVEIARIIKERGYAWKILVVGDGDLRKKMEEQIEFFDLQNYLILEGWKKDTTIIYHQFDVTLIPSQWEGFGLTACESICSKIPVITSGVGGLKDIIIHNETGLVVEKPDPNEYIIQILRLQNEKGLKELIVKNAYERVTNNFSIDKEVKEHFRLFEQ